MTKRGNMTRQESPSSINTYNLCKRKYYYSYKLNLPRKDNISTITGKAVHDALENFFKIDTSSINKSNYEFILKHELINLFNNSWTKALPSLLNLENDKNTIRNYYQNSIYMLQNFIEDFLIALSSFINDGTFQDAFNKLKPKTEVHLYSEKHNVHGYLDAILNINGEVYIIDYKTSSKDNITEDYKLQLAIYSLMFNEKFGKLPNKVGLHFLRHGTKKYIDVSQDLIDTAGRECELIKFNTESNDIKDYDKNPGSWCKWKDGQCSFYGICYGVKKLEDYNEENLIQIKRN